MFDICLTVWLAEMAEGLNGENFDVVVVGTGLTESVLAAALSLSGKTVLHLDKVS